MKAIIIRILIVIWLLFVSVVIYGIFEYGLDDILQGLFVGTVSILAIQFILTGIVNPITLFSKRQE